MRAFFSLVSGILIAIMLFACAPATQVVEPGGSNIMPTLTPAGSSGSGVNQPIPLATSRGDKLEASPPISVKYGAGRPVLVEFFRFT
jgi:hypothetical protein